MIGNILGIALCTSLSFSLFFFTTPYTTGMELRDVTDNGIYRFLYVAISTMGDLVYKFIEFVFATICEVTGWRKLSFGVVFLNTIAYMFVVICASNLYEVLMSSVIQGDVVEFKKLGETSYGNVKDLVLVAQIYGQLRNNMSESGFISTIFATVKALVLFFSGTMVYFTFMHGLLTQKMYDFDIITRVVGEERKKEILDFKSDGVTLSDLPKAIFSGVCNFVDNLGMLQNFRFRAIQIAFAVACFIYATVKALLGEAATFGDLLFNLLDEAEIINIFVSFMFTYISAKATSFFADIVYKKLPENMQMKISELSERGNHAVTKIQKSRDLWSSRRDAVWEAMHKEPKRDISQYYITNMDLENN